MEIRLRTRPRQSEVRNQLYGHAPPAMELREDSESLTTPTVRNSRPVSRGLMDIHPTIRDEVGGGTSISSHILCILMYRYFGIFVGIIPGVVARATLLG